MSMHARHVPIIFTLRVPCLRRILALCRETLPFVYLQPVTVLWFHAPGCCGGNGDVAQKQPVRVCWAVNYNISFSKLLRGPGRGWEGRKPHPQQMTQVGTLCPRVLVSTIYTKSGTNCTQQTA
ncbi:hypothetical protein NDU88_005782 [Pleurodeles waltl]|uniref:Secreted protein n=1 Tax=Pleurodeles waltl TaxID=8319 RepID=A0AAV7WAJ2_PLEWA|nr:hypothetical protein NDU88_005782 [Pleurodeles waltl]